MTLPLDPILLMVGAPVIVLVFFLSARGGKRGKAPSYPYDATPSLFTPNERVFLRVLEGAAEDYRVFGKVRVADVVQVRKGFSKGESQTALNRITQKHLDFVLCHPQDLRVFCVIELDDKTHQRRDRRERDAFLDRALEAAQIPLLCVPSRRDYDVGEVRALLSTYTGEKKA